MKICFSPKQEPKEAGETSKDTTRQQETAVVRKAENRGGEKRNGNRRSNHLGNLHFQFAATNKRER